MLKFLLKSNNFENTDFGAAFERSVVKSKWNQTWRQLGPVENLMRKISKSAGSISDFFSGLVHCDCSPRLRYFFSPHCCPMTTPELYFFRTSPDQRGPVRTSRTSWSCSRAEISKSARQPLEIFGYLIVGVSPYGLRYFSSEKKSFAKSRKIPSGFRVTAL